MCCCCHAPMAESWHCPCGQSSQHPHDSMARQGLLQRLVLIDVDTFPCIAAEQLQFLAGSFSPCAPSPCQGQVQLGPMAACGRSPAGHLWHWWVLKPLQATCLPWCNTSSQRCLSSQCPAPTWLLEGLCLGLCMGAAAGLSVKGCTEHRPICQRPAPHGLKFMR